MDMKEECAEVQRTAWVGINSREEEGKWHVYSGQSHPDWQSVSGHRAKQEVNLAKRTYERKSEPRVQTKTGCYLGITLNVLAWSLDRSCFLCSLKDDLWLKNLSVYSSVGRMTAYKDWCERAPLAHLPQYNWTSQEWQDIASTKKIKSNSRTPESSPSNLKTWSTSQGGNKVHAPTQ
jgi:hypothetical protein